MQEQKKVSVDDFQMIKVLGRGCMGKVMLVREHRSKKLFAMKAISKEWVILQREIEHTKSERNILANVARISHPFLIKLRHSFQSNAQLFMVLDYYPGGDIATQLAKWHRFEPARCLFYAAEIVLGIEELHRQGIVYRDLKPENILLALDGHIVLTDFGLSKQFQTLSAEDKTSTFCGTAEYLAPEILLAAEYSYPVDWWSLGTLLYEMLCGITPFWAEHHAEMYQRVLEDDLEFPDDMDQDASDFIGELLDRDPEYRLGNNGPEEVKAHPYFASIDWDVALQRKLPCPYVPELVSEEDLSNFDDAYLTMTPRLTPGNHTLSNSIQNCFQGYSYTDKMASTLPRSDSKLPADPSSSYVQEYEEAGANGRQPLYRTRLQEMEGEDEESDSEEEEEEEEEEDTTYPAMAQLYTPPSAAISAHIETKAAVTSPALTPPSTYREEGRMPVERMSIGRMAAADILRGYSRTRGDHRHSTGSASSSGTIGRRLSRG
ncbi:kinase-like domain-containing protein [Mortierella sp. GBAus27b]|nr:kinase-like domain-containing protein [Mortierella sp. GBAus27b]